jgi:hypothetical protein
MDDTFCVFIYILYKMGEWGSNVQTDQAIHLCMYVCVCAIAVISVFPQVTKFNLRERNSNFLFLFLLILTCVNIKIFRLLPPAIECSHTNK